MDKEVYILKLDDTGGEKKQTTIKGCDSEAVSRVITRSNSIHSK